MKQRELWLDYLRAFACILVTIGHLLMSFQDAGIIKDTSISSVFISFLYCFHVFIFFFCSGYLFQKGKDKFSTHGKAFLSRLTKTVDFLVLYILFSGVTFLIKTLFSSEVNSSVEYNFIEVIAQHPLNQMWYLYAISIIFLCAHLMRSETSAWIILGIAATLKIIICIPGVNALIPIPASYIFSNLIWFVLGQLLAFKQLKLNSILSFSVAAVFITLFVLSTVFSWNCSFLSAILTLLGITGSAGIIYTLTKNKEKLSWFWKYISKYMLQIYLLHTIFAAGVRIVLIKIGITHIIPHLIAGLAVSFVCPIICAVIAQRIPVLNIFFFPTKTIKQLFAKRARL